jgi:circadian clock protein KaiC
MRGVAFRGGYHDFTGGIEVFPRLSTEEQRRRPPKDVVTSMSPELDQMLGGGLRRGTSTLLIGPAGSGTSGRALLCRERSGPRREVDALRLRRRRRQRH